MIFCDGFLNYPKLTPEEWVNQEAPNFTNEGIIGVVCDDQEKAFRELSPLLMEANSKIITIDSENSITDYLRVDKDISLFTDKMYDYIWREFMNKYSGYFYPPENTPFIYDFEHIDRKSRDEDFIVVVFIVLNEKIKCVDHKASDIAYDYTAIGINRDNKRHRDLRKNLYKYFIYDQDEDFIYHFIDFTR